MKKKLVALLMSAVMASALLAGCGTAKDAETEQETVEDAAETETEAGSEDADAAAEDANAEAESEESNESNESADAQEGEAVVLKCVCDLTPHSEILNAAADLLSEKGIELDIVSTTWDATWNDMLVDGEIDFAYFMHVPAMESIEEEMGATLYSMGGIHVEPYACFSDKYASKDELPENAVIAIPNDSSNEYRALKVLEAEGFIKLNPDMTAIDASVNQIDEYIIPIEIVEMDQANIIPSAADFDAYFVNVNRALEADIDTTAYLMREGEDSEYANIITVTEANKDNEAIKTLVSVLQSDEVKKFIEENFNGAVIPAK
ncbi:MetQ/NlpA family ABC transporter substrate-binding protein [Parablautia intestinalis]|uniref:MetQ/NlpA family ABC transporter substrate-binding protein n=1 Tax=Parablautia intestinalis TaxID=2320100 RepID=UPI00256F149A|nr:MetQ/NlpA family ABC transporter substrate-binding protein [Parablautia intestinalis]